jgi:uncharacterized protein
MLLIPTYLAPSPIHGLGLFTAVDVPRGTLLWVFRAGLDLEYEQPFVDSLPPLARARLLHYCYREPGASAYVLCGDDARFWNHSDAPNCENAPIPGTDAWGTAAARDIARDEELTCDYRTFDAMERDL